MTQRSSVPDEFRTLHSEAPASSFFSMTAAPRRQMEAPRMPSKLTPVPARRRASSSRWSRS